MTDEIISLDELYKKSRVFRHFLEISKIPRCSKKEGKIIEYISSLAEKNAHTKIIDDAGNLIVYVQASPDRIGQPFVALQSHLDMVCEKNENTAHDFQKEPLSLLIENGMLFADGTTLGADNGIGVSMMLALMDGYSSSHPPLELIFTVDEEAGMSGALNLERNFLKSSRLINLDTEEDDRICIGCSGGGESVIRLSMANKSTAENFTALRMDIKGLRGGHSGLNIHTGRQNAIRILAMILDDAVSNTELRLSLVEGGRMVNAIPREAYAVIAVKDRSLLEKSAALVCDKIRSDYGSIESGLTAEITDASEHLFWNSTDSINAIRLLNALPSGVLEMSHAMEGLVDTSTNLGTVHSSDTQIAIGCLSRSSRENSLQFVRNQIKNTARLAGAEVEECRDYPPWPYSLKSPFLQRILDIYKNKIRRSMQTIAVHAGLETGIIAKKYPDMDMISIGPNIHFPHSPKEHVEIKSAERIWSDLQIILSEI